MELAALMVESEDPVVRVFGEVIQLREKKSADYNAGAVKLQDYFPFGTKSYVQMIWTKALRLRSLAGEREPKNESLEDTCKDIMNYAAFMVAHLR
jgi:hypothetical protein